MPELLSSLAHEIASLQNQGQHDQAEQLRQLANEMGLGYL